MANALLTEEAAPAEIAPKRGRGRAKAVDPEADDEEVDEEDLVADVAIEAVVIEIVDDEALEEDEDKPARPAVTEDLFQPAPSYCPWQTMTMTSLSTPPQSPVLLADPVKDYLKQIGKVPLLNAVKRLNLPCVLKLVSLLKTSWQPRRTFLSSSSVNFVGSPAMASAPRATCSVPTCVWLFLLRSVYTGRGMQFLDLIQEGNLGSDSCS